MDHLIEVQNLKKYFKTGRGTLHAVDDVSFTIPKGTTLGVVGESGCGKSTLGRMLVHLLESTDGRILFEGEDVTTLGKRDMKDYHEHAQMIFQDPYSSLNPRYTVEESIREFLVVSGKFNKSEIQRKTTDLMDLVGIAPRLRMSYPHELDGGRRQRVGIARALALNPEFIVCDEPVSALDVSIQAQILNLLKFLQQEKNLTYMFITHDLSVVRHISDEIAVMYLGQCVERCGSKELFDNPLHPYTKALLDAIQVPDISLRGKKKPIIRGEVTSPIDPKPGCRFAARCPRATDACWGSQIPLREVSAGHYAACNLI